MEAVSSLLHSSSVCSVSYDILPPCHTRQRVVHSPSSVRLFVLRCPGLVCRRHPLCWFVLSMSYCHSELRRPANQPTSQLTACCLSFSRSVCRHSYCSTSIDAPNCQFSAITRRTCQRPQLLNLTSVTTSFIDKRCVDVSSFGHRDDKYLNEQQLCSCVRPQPQIVASI